MSLNNAKYATSNKTKQFYPGCVDKQKNDHIQWQLINTYFMGIGILVLVIRTVCYPTKL